MPMKKGSQVSAMKWLRVSQSFPRSDPLDIPARVEAAVGKFHSQVGPGFQVALTVGSRGITNLREIVSCTVQALKAMGAEPFIVPAMGSHGGATAEAQVELLGSYGVTSENLNVPMAPSMETTPLGETEAGVEVRVSSEALKADGILVLNRIKPHTDFSGHLGSGLLKMMVVGMGKRDGASLFHRGSSRWGYIHTLTTIAGVILEKAPILGGVAIVEDGYHQTARIEGLHPYEMIAKEKELFQYSKGLMPHLPLEEIDLLIVDRIGKNISGAGMDPNIIGRSAHGYSGLLGAKNDGPPYVRRILVRDLTPESHGNAIGIGMADFTTTRLLQQMDPKITSINALTGMVPHVAKTPIHFDTDHEAVETAIDTLALGKKQAAAIVRIQDTLNLEQVLVEAASAKHLADREDIEILESITEEPFDRDGNFNGW